MSNSNQTITIPLPPSPPSFCLHFDASGLKGGEEADLSRGQTTVEKTMTSGAPALRGERSGNIEL